MSDVYKNQTLLKFRLNLGMDITGATITLKYIKPDTTSGEFTDTFTVVSAAKGVIDWEPVNDTILADINTWTFWAYIVDSNSKEAAGKPFTVKIKTEGT